MIRVLTRCALTAAAISLLSIAQAAASTPTPSPSPLPQIAHVVTSDRAAEPLTRSVRTTYVITKAQMLRDGDRSVADALAKVPGATLNRYGPFGSQTSLSLLGSSAAQVLVLLDGMPVAGAQLGGADVGAFSTSGVERIEVVEGGGSTLYGSGSVGGVVNIITTPATRASAVASIGSFGTSTFAFESPYLSFSRTQGNNAYPLPDGSSHENAAGGLSSLRMGYRHRLGVIEATLSADASNESIGVPGSFNFFSPTSHQNTLVRDARLELSQTRANSTLSLQLGESTQSIAYTCNTPIDVNCPNSFATTPTPYADLLNDLRTMASLRDVVGSGSERMLFGIDLTRGFARIDDGTDPYSINSYAQTAAYAQSQWSARNGDEFYIGMRGERDGAQGGEFTPSIGGKYHLSRSAYLRANAATAFDAPSAELLYYPGFSNPNLAAERLRVGDVTLVAPRLGGGFTFGWFATAGTNLIVANPPNYIPDNVGHALVEGFTLGVKSRRTHGFQTSLDITDLYRAEDLDTLTRLSGRGPVLQTRLGFMYRPAATKSFDGFGISATTEGSQGAYDPTLPAFAQSLGYTRVDAYLGYRIGRHAALTLRGYDLGNERYAQFSGYPLPGRSFTLEIRTR